MRDTMSAGQGTYTFKAVKMLDGNDTSHRQQCVFITRGDANTWSSVIFKD